MAIAVGSALREHGIHAVLTGGACASIYTRGRYTSDDADFVLSGRVLRRDLDRAMASLGFARKGDRYVRRMVGFFVEFPTGPLAIGADHEIRPVELTSGKCVTLALSATDSCRDRLAAYFHGGDRQSLDVAIEIALENRLDWAVIRTWSEREGFLEQFEEFRAAVQRKRRRKRTPPKEVRSAKR